MQYLRLISPGCSIVLESGVRQISRVYKFNGIFRFSILVMDQVADNTLNSEPAVKEKSAKELKKEAQRQAKLEKFKKKQEQQAALKEAQNDVS